MSTRALNFPSIPPGGVCPVSPVQQFASPPGQKLPGYGYGPGPLFLSGQTEWYSGVASLFMVAPSYGGRIMIRGRQLDGSNGLPFQDQSNGRITIEPAAAGSWRWVGDMILGPPGCYAIQADGTNFSEVIVFSIRPGPAPPA